MSSKDKLIKKLKSKPKDLTWDELTRLLGALNFEVHLHLNLKYLQLH